MRRYLHILCILCLVPAGFARAQDTRENAEYKLASGLYNDGLFSQAEDQLRVFIEKFPNTALGIEARLLLGQCQVKLRKTAEARATFQDFALRFHDHARAPEALWNLAELYLAERNFPEAGSAFARIRTFYPRDKRAPAALLQAAYAFLKAGDAENARIALHALLGEYPQSDVAQEGAYAMARQLVVAGDYDRALKEFSRIENGGAPAALKARAIVAAGQVHALLGNRPEAEAKYRQVLTSYANTETVHEAHVRFGDLLRGLRRYDEAEKEYNAVIAAPAASAELRDEAMTGIAEGLEAQERHAEAVKAWETLFAATREIALDPAVTRSAARSAALAGQHGAAARWLEQLIEDTARAVDRRSVMVELARVQSAARNPHAAIAWYQRYLQNYPTDAGAPYAALEIAGIQEKEFGNTARARDLYLVLIDRYGSSAVADRAQMGLARCLETLGRNEDAAAAYAQVNTQFPSSSYAAEAAQRERAIRRFSRGDAGKALETVASLLGEMRRQATSPAVDGLLGTLYLEDLRDPERALQAFSSALSAGATGDDAERASFGRALALIRLAQRDPARRPEAEQQAESTLAQYTSSARRDDLAWELFLLRSEGAQPVAVIDAAMKFQALTPSAHTSAARLAAADALRQAGRTGDAERDYTALVGDADATIAASALYGRGRVRASQQNFNAAVEDLRASEQKLPNGEHAADAAFALASVLARVGQYPEAARVYLSVAERFPWSPLADSARPAGIAALLDANMNDRARLETTSYLRACAGNPFAGEDATSAALYLQAVVLARLKDQAAAKRSLQQYIADYPRGRQIGEAYFALGQIFKSEGKIALATSYLRSAADRTQGTSARQDAAELLMDEGRYDDAAREYEKIAAAATTPLETSYALSRIAVALYRAGRPEDAQARVAEFNRAYPDAASVAIEFELERGKFLFRQKQYDKAMDIFEEIADADVPEMAAWGSYWVGCVHETRNMDDKARRQFTEVLAEHPKAEAARESSLALARMAVRAEAWDVAAQYSRAVAESPGVPSRALKEALGMLISSYEEMKMYDGAIEMTKRFLAAFPYDATVFRKRVNMGVYYYQLGFFEQAITHLASLYTEAVSDDQAEIQYYIGECYYYKGDFTQAALEFLKVPYLASRKTEIDWTASAYYMAGQSYEKLSKFQNALDMYQKILSSPGIDARYKAQAEKEAARVRALINP